VLLSARWIGIMLRKSHLHGALTLGLAVAVAYLALTRREPERSHEVASLRPPGAALELENPISRRASGPSAERELARVRQALLSQALATSASTMSPAPAQDPLTLAQATLDERLLRGGSGSSESARLDGLLRPLLVPSVLGEAVAELRCNTTLCKISLIAEDDSRVGRATSLLSERLPKTFAAVVVYPDGTGHRSVYVSTRPTDLELSPAPDVVARHEPAK
jgi:hypothetical protein